MIRRVGHVRVFAALGSTISAVLILYPALTEPWAWVIGRVVIGFCFCGVYVTAESWLNNAANNETRGKALSLYMIVQMAGIVLAQYILVLGDVDGFILFIIPSVLVSLAFAPILLSVRPTPAFETTKPLSLKDLIAASPLACMGMFILGGVFAAQFGMSAVYGTRVGLSIGQISFMVSMIYIAALLAQYPIGWLSDRMDRRILILATAAVGAVGAIVALLGGNSFALIVAGAAVMGATSNPLYALLIAYANDYLEHEDMAAASAGLLFINGVGAVAGPLIVGWFMEMLGPQGFWVYVGALMFGLTVYGLWRMMRRPSRATVGDSVSYAPVLANASPIAVEVAQEVYIDAELEEQNVAEGTNDG
jgi:MFS family permease